MQIDLQPSAQSTYRRTLIERGCPPNLAAAAAEVLASDGNRTEVEQQLIDRAWAAVTN